ncbi:hypothetical protein [Desulfosporosinus youngiae]|uniref:hypothetical protein n=1 Tax=Desulfosporosinus youngiae TaxID=339862 RepID=UPI00145DB57A|nr:hypothetical protein [Desulfosporosinus youngiae]
MAGGVACAWTGIWPVCRQGCSKAGPKGVENQGAGTNEVENTGVGTSCRKMTVDWRKM